MLQCCWLISYGVENSFELWSSALALRLQTVLRLDLHLHPWLQSQRALGIPGANSVGQQPPFPMMLLGNDGQQLQRPHNPIAYLIPSSDPSRVYNLKGGSLGSQRKLCSVASLPIFHISLQAHNGPVGTAEKSSSHLSWSHCHVFCPPLHLEV